MSPASLASLALITTLSACGTGSSPGAAPRATVPAPDLCKVISRRTVTVAMHGRPSGCESIGDANSRMTRFTGTARLSGRRAPVALAISYDTRRDPRTGADRWRTVGHPTGSRVSLLGVGESAVFDPKHSPQLRTTQGDLIVSVALKVTGAPVPQTKLPDNLQAVASEAVAAAR